MSTDRSIKAASETAPKKTRNRPKQKTGRKLLPIDAKVVEGMASVGATDTEIADFCGCTEGTIRKRFSEILTKRRSGMRKRLRQAQLTAALGGNPAMLIWLGKQMLDQKDKSDITSGDKPIAPQTINIRLVEPDASGG